ncbi:MAG: Glu-tRNA(Gln) amidotransferase subunit GatD [Candidatus Woesearchaeota archaeon]|jgi:glutamyl-tRNA(Gln) amidotransferase subunit D|nr:Glu-tRNA(Gln) amidotransferase subunit GatD [Candidatus Woesearchaeota archaeon]MDP7622562.1 Glu-tRNA(Gln) amidotransferase subunit GatD [Candidatus Woesearchaeota archaeon]HJN57274.1 Glu-tRNA(Gln) amidotransferase subunit GatD [Candidatus Woesearchaeota archaeon]|tara:strand:+ start:3938 stop:5242 length:1305 start_codon:yes stop_codon:yes gene_type:complete
MNAKAGDKVKVTAKDEIIEGILMPNEETDSVVIKLDNGYNIGIGNKKIKEIKVIEKYKEAKSTPKSQIKKDSKKPTIAILHTGGTIASKVDYRTGGVYSSFNPEDLLEMFPEMFGIANFSSKLIANMWSDDLRFKHFEIITKAVEKEVKKGVDGIIIGMGTDNLAVASAALAFIIEETPIPILLVGAQRSSDRGSSDAAMNLISAAEFIAKTDFAGVGICMHESTSDNTSAILPPCKTAKLHSSRRDAFKPVNDTLIARIDYDTKKVEFIKKDYLKKDKKGKLVIKPRMEEKIGLLKIHVNMFPEQFEFYKGYKGLIIEGTGLGHTPGQAPNEWCKIHEKIYPALKKVIDSGCIIVMTTQCLFGKVHMHVYDKGVDLTKIGVIPGKDMLAETAFIKLSWLLGNCKKEEVKELITKNLRGEINDRLMKDEFLDLT